MRILYVTTVSGTINAFLVPHIEMLFKEGHQVDVACNIIKPLSPQLKVLGSDCYDIPFSRSPFSKQNIIAYKKIKKLIIENKYNVVHTHTPTASACVRLACRKLKNVKVIYTVHGFHFYKGAPLLNWLLYFPLELWMSKFTDVLITINREDFIVAKNKLKTPTVKYVHGVGLNTNKSVSIDMKKIVNKTDLGIPENSFLIISVGELNKNKNHISIIKSLEIIPNDNIYYIVCGQGSLKEKHEHYLKEVGLEKKVKFLGYRTDIPELLNISNAFTFPSLREGLSVSLMEAMHAGLPVVCSDIRGNNDLIEDKKGGFLVKANDYKGFAEYIQLLYNDKKLAESMVRFNKERIKEFNLDIVTEELYEIYKTIEK